MPTKKTDSSEEPDSSTGRSEMTTVGPGSEATSRVPGIEATTRDSGIGPTTHKVQKKTRKTTTASSGERDSPTDRLEITTAGSRSEATTSESGTKTSTEGSGSEATTGGSETEPITGNSGMGSTTRIGKKKRRKTTTALRGEPDSTTDGLDMTTAGSVSEATTSESSTETSTEGSGSEATTGDSGMGSKTRKEKKKRRKTTTTGGSEMETTTGSSGKELTTLRPKIKTKIFRITTTALIENPESSTDGSEITSEEFGLESTTKGSEEEITIEDSEGQETEHPDTRSTAESTEDLECKETTEHPHTGPTTESVEDSEYGEATEHTGTRSTAESTENLECKETTDDLECKETTEHPDTGPTTESIEDLECGEATEHPDTESIAELKEDSDCKETIANSDTGSTTESTDELNTTTEEEPKSTSTTEASTTTKRTIRPITTTKSIGRTTTRRTNLSGTSMTTTASGGGITGGSETTTTTEGSGWTTTIDDSGNTTTEAIMTTTEQQSTTMRGPKDCKGKHKWYSLCAPSCPQQTCGDYLNGVKCSKKIGLPKCKPECRCLLGYYKDVEGNCLSTWECKRWAISMASSTTTGNLNNQDTTAASTSTMMTTIPDPNCADVAKKLFIKRNLAYTVMLLSDMSKRDPDNNVLVGGASILYLFAQLVLEVKDTVKTEILKVFNLPDTQHVRCFFPEISALLTAKYPDIEYSLFCKIYANQGYALTDGFIQRTTQLFVMGPENLNFSSLEAAQKINSDVAQYTNDHFLNYVKPRTLLSLDGLVLVDAEGFQGKWKKQFDPANTRMKDFSSPDRVDKIPMMYQKGLFLFTRSATLNAKILKLKYRSGRFSLVIILPNSIYEIKDLLRKMGNPSNVASALDSLKYEKVNVHLPKFNVSVANLLKMSSEMAGIKEIFNNSTTGLEDIGSKKPPYVGEILQRLNFAVNEYGMGDKLDVDFDATEAIPYPPQFAITHTFKADHPFFYSLQFDELVLNAGLFVN